MSYLKDKLDANKITLDEYNKTVKQLQDEAIIGKKQKELDKSKIQELSSIDKSAQLSTLDTNIPESARIAAAQDVTRKADIADQATMANIDIAIKGLSDSQLKL